MNDYNESEKSMLIESMAKLIEYYKNNTFIFNSGHTINSFLNQLTKPYPEYKFHQEEIFQSLTSNDILKILSNLEDSNSSLRKTSSRFLCELLYDNQMIQNEFCDLTGLLPIDGKVCVNRIPDSFQDRLRFLPQIMETINRAIYPLSNNQSPICWYFTSENNNEEMKVQYIFPQDLHSRNPNEFIDPINTLFGFYIFNSSLQLNNNQTKKKQFDFTTILPNKRDVIPYHSTQQSISSARLSPAKKRDPYFGGNNNMLSSSINSIKKMNFTNQRDDLSYSEKKDIESKAISKSTHFPSKISQEISASYLHPQHFSKYHYQDFSGVSLTAHQGDDSSPTHKTEAAFFQSLSSKESLKPDAKIRLGNQNNLSNSNPSNVLERRKTTEQILEKNFKFQPSFANATINVKSQLNSASNTSSSKQRSNSKLTQYHLTPGISNPQKKEQISYSGQSHTDYKTKVTSIKLSSQHPQQQSTTPQTVQELMQKSFQQQQQYETPNQQNSKQNGSIEFKRKLVSQYESQKAVVINPLKDKRYSQQETLGKGLSNYSISTAGSNSQRSSHNIPFSRSTQEQSIGKIHNSPNRNIIESSSKMPAQVYSGEDFNFSSNYINQPNLSQNNNNSEGFIFSGNQFVRQNQNKNNNAFSKSLSIHSKH